MNDSIELVITNYKNLIDSNFMYLYQFLLKSKSV